MPKAPGLPFWKNGTPAFTKNFRTNQPVRSSNQHCSFVFVKRKAGIALGSNLGDRYGHIEAAIAALQGIHEGPESDFRVATIIETEPVDCEPGTPGFLNTVLELDTSLEPLELFDVCQKIEEEAGRPGKRAKNSPRTIDVDLLYLGALEMDTDRLILPHPRMHERDFVMEPLREIGAEFPRA